MANLLLGDSVLVKCMFTILLTYFLPNFDFSREQIRAIINPKCPWQIFGTLVGHNSKERTT